MPDLNQTENTNDNIVYTPNKLNRAYLYEVIKKISPCSIYKLAKQCKESYKTIWLAVRDMEFAGVIQTHVEIIDGRENKIITIPEFKEEKKTPEKEADEIFKNLNIKSRRQENEREKN